MSVKTHVCPASNCRATFGRDELVGGNLPNHDVGKDTYSPPVESYRSIWSRRVNDICSMSGKGPQRLRVAPPTGGRGKYGKKR